MLILYGAAGDIYNAEFHLTLYRWDTVDARKTYYL